MFRGELLVFREGFSVIQDVLLDLVFDLLQDLVREIETKAAAVHGKNGLVVKSRRTWNGRKSTRNTNSETTLKSTLSFQTELISRTLRLRQDECLILLGHRYVMQTSI